MLRSVNEMLHCFYFCFFFFLLEGVESRCAYYSVKSASILKDVRGHIRDNIDRRHYRAAKWLNFKIHIILMILLWRDDELEPRGIQIDHLDPPPVIILGFSNTRICDRVLYLVALHGCYHRVYFEDRVHNVCSLAWYI